MARQLPKVETDKRLLNSLQTIKTQLSQVIQEQQKQKTYIKMLMKETRNFQTDAYKNFQILDDNVEGIRDTVDILQNTVDTVSNRTKSLHRHVKGLRKLDTASTDTESPAWTHNVRPAHTRPRIVNRHFDSRLDTNHLGFPLSNDNLSDSDTETEHTKTYKRSTRSHSKSGQVKDGKGHQSSSKSKVNHQTVSPSAPPMLGTSLPITNNEHVNNRAPQQTGSPSFFSSSGSDQMLTPTGNDNTAPVYSETSQLTGNQPVLLVSANQSRAMDPRMPNGPAMTEIEEEIKEGDESEEENQSVMTELTPLISKQPMEQEYRKVMARLGLDLTDETLAACVQASMVTGERGGAHAVPMVTGLHTVLILDTSNSMAGSPFKQLQVFVDLLLDSVDNAAAENSLEESIAVVTCGEEVGIKQSFTRDYNQVRSVTENLQVSGRTPLMAALTLALFYLEIQGETFDFHGHKIHPRVVLISDGVATNSTAFTGPDEGSSTENIQVQQKLFALAEEFGKRNYPIFCVGVKRFNEALLKQIAENSDGELVSINSGLTVGKYYMYQTLVGEIFELCDVEREEGQEVDIEHIIAEKVKEKGLQKEDQDMIHHFVEVTLMNGNTPTESSEEEDEEEEDKNKTDTHASTYLSQNSPQQAGQLRQPVRGQVSQLTRPGGQPTQGVQTNAPPQMTQQRTVVPWNPGPDLSQYSLEERADLPSLGTRVMRGPHWEDEDKDERGLGTVICHSAVGQVTVLWDNNNVGAYRFKGPTFDVAPEHKPRVVQPGEIDIGCSVKRGSNWRRGDEDGGTGTVGVVVRKHPDRNKREVQVRWPSRIMDFYKFGAEGIYEIEVTQELPRSPPQPYTDPQAPQVIQVNYAREESTLSTLPQSMTGYNTTVLMSPGGHSSNTLQNDQQYDASSELEDDSPLVHAWQWTEGDIGLWRHFDVDQNEILETKHQINRDGQCTVKILGQDVMCNLLMNTFTFMSNNQKGSIQRNVLTEREYREGMALEQEIRNGT